MYAFGAHCQPALPVDKSEFEDMSIPSIDFTIIAAPGTNCLPALASE